ncbi:hypothetical protein CRE_13981 [Caenorhabditis remanei]|uniref:F-box domain-containing protein n=1 Tax=Caenorhabditis remanei TaxID=31234 RepID=E3M8N0_CAERE|nr:hypothetical protein CRE_13981 [Caenorhabditis remanei]
MSPLPLLRLPFLPLQNIIQNWNIYEICEFAKVSKRTKNIAKVATRKVVNITLYSYESFVIDTFFTEKGIIVPWNHCPQGWRFELKDISERDNTESEAYNENNRTHTFTLTSDNPLLLFLETLQLLFEVFDCSIHSVYWNSWKTEDMRQVIDWMNSFEKVSAIEKVQIVLNKDSLIKFSIFLETFQKKLVRFIIFSDRRGETLIDEIPVKYSNLLEIERIDDHSRAKWVNLSNLLSMNCKTPNLGVSLLSNQDLNVFLRSWKEGRSNSILEALRVYVPEPEDWKTVLNGLGAVVRHPTQVTRRYIEKVWFYGGVDIQRVDGTIGTVMWTHYLGRDKHEKIPKNLLEAFEKTKQEWVGTDSDVVFEERGNEIQVSDEEKVIEQYIPTQNCFNFSFVVWK